MATNLGKAVIEVTAGFGDFGKTLENGIGDAITSTGFAIGNAMEEFGQRLFKRFTVPFAIAAAANVAQWQGLERAIGETLTLFGTAPSIIDETFDSMSAGIANVSREVGGLERDIADGLYQTISAGVPRSDAFEFLEVAQLAATADKTSDLTTAVDGITTAINSFGLSFSDAEIVADQFFSTVAQGKTTFGELSTDLGRVAPLAANAGASLAETLAIIGQLTKGGLQTSESVSFLRGAITGLLRPTAELNELFREAGFASAEAAVPVIGLQGAFQTVVDASGGSISKLQELIGTSEGVTAILGVTGENADAFANTLRGVENSAGSTQAAFDIIDGTLSRSFGRVTEAFDRLGNLFGSFGGEFAQPVVDLFADIVSSVVENFRKITPVVRNVANVFKGLIAIFDNPAFKFFASTMASVFVSIYGLLGIVGGLSLGFGKLLLVVLKLITASKGIQLVSGYFDTLRLGALYAGDAMQLFGKNLAKNVPLISGLGRVIQGLGITFSTTGGAMLAAAGAFAAIAAAIAGAIYLWSRWQDSVRATFEAQQTFTIGTERLAAAVGATTQALELGTSATEDYNTTIEEFLLLNGDLVGRLQEVQLEQGNIAARDFALQITADLQLKGASAQEAFDAIKLLFEGADLTLPLTFEDVKGQDQLGDLLSGFDLQIEEWNREVEDGLLSFNDITDAQITNTVAGLTDGFAAATRSGRTAEFFESLNEQAGNLDNVNLADQLVINLGKSIEELSGRDLKLSEQSIIRAANPVKELVRQLDLVNAITPEVQASLDNLTGPDFEYGTGTGDDDLNALDEMEQRIPGVVNLTDQQLSTLTQLKGQIDSVFQVGTDYIVQTFNDIKSGITEQLPLLGIYSGAVEQSFDAWVEGQNQFQADAAAISTVREQLVDGVGEFSQEMINAFDAAPVGQQAWLAYLGEDELKVALKELAESFEVRDTEAAQRFGDNLAATVAGANAAMAEEYQKLSDAAADAGTGVANLFEINFANRSESWADVTTTALAEIQGIINNTTITGPVVGPPTFSSADPPGPTNGPPPPGVEITVNTTDNSTIGADIQRAAALAQAVLT